MNILKRIGGTLMLPAAGFVVMMILCFSHGKMYFGTWMMWKTLIVDIAVSVTCGWGSVCSSNAEDLIFPAAPLCW